MVGFASRLTFLAATFLYGCDSRFILAGTGSGEVVTVVVLVVVTVCVSVTILVIVDVPVIVMSSLVSE